MEELVIGSVPRRGRSNLTSGHQPRPHSTCMRGSVAGRRMHAVVRRGDRSEMPSPDLFVARIELL